MSDWDDAERCVERARQLFQQRRWSEALEELRSAIAIDPYNAGWFFNLGLTLDELGRFDEAVQAYQQSLAIEDDDLEAINHLAIDLYRIGKPDEAIAAFEQIEKQDPSFEPAYCNRIIIYGETGQHEKAEEIFYLARLFREHCPHCYYNIALSLKVRGQLQKAIYCWRKTLDLDEGNVEAHLRLGEALREQGELEQSRRHYVTALRKDPGNTGTMLDLGDLLLEMGRTEEAGEKYRHAIELAPEEAAGHYCYGRWLVRQRRDEEAVVAFTRALRHDAAFPGANLELAKLHRRHHHPVSMRRHVRRELALRPQEARVLLELANLLWDVGRRRPSMACLKRLVELHPGFAPAWQNLAVNHFGCGQYEQGMECCRRAVELDGSNMMAVYNMAVALSQQGHYDAALQWVGRALEIRPRDGMFLQLEFRLRVFKFFAWLRGRL